MVVLFVPGMPKPYPAIPSEDYSVCKACDSVFRFVDKVQDAHPVLRNAAGRWTRAVLVFSDGDGMDVTATRKATAAA